jgi:hypothetical protein
MPSSFFAVAQAGSVTFATHLWKPDHFGLQGRTRRVDYARAALADPPRLVLHGAAGYEGFGPENVMHVAPPPPVFATLSTHTGRHLEVDTRQICRISCLRRQAAQARDTGGRYIQRGAIGCSRLFEAMPTVERPAAQAVMSVRVPVTISG